MSARAKVEVAVCADWAKIGGAEGEGAESARAVGLPLLFGDGFSKDALPRGKQLGAAVAQRGGEEGQIGGRAVV